MPKITPAARRALTEQRKAQILTAAAKVFAAKGFERATSPYPAAAAGIAEVSIYNYFKNKNDLLVSLPRQIIEPTVESVSARTTLVGTPPLPPEQMLTTAARGMVSSIQKNGHIFRALLSTLPSMKQSARQKYFDQVVLYGTGVLESYFKQQIDLGVFRQDADSKILARAFVGMFFPTVLVREVLQVDETWDRNYDQVIAEAVSVFLRGVLVESSERKVK